MLPLLPLITHGGQGIWLITRSSITPKPYGFLDMGVGKEEPGHFRTEAMEGPGDHYKEREAKLLKWRRDRQKRAFQNSIWQGHSKGITWGKTNIPVLNDQRSSSMPHRDNSSSFQNVMDFRGSQHEKFISDNSFLYPKEIKY
ncbi:hypothetical protein NPIL_303851 [Nephila pilipes]|uniref:Uncharacterized protein n=1 Tax=Nephila pilipes TaxID=299642 RepID=A0A8X6TCE4_NEPPI|nr:hypothetical protein NPIL_303851 [Nephila pilipes]